MRKVLKVIQIIAIILAIAEILIFGIFITLYITDIASLQDFISVEGIAYITIVIVLVNLIALGAFVFALSLNNQRNDLKTKEIIGKEINESFIFGQIGFVVLDETNKVIWASELFESQDIHLLNRDIFEWCEELEEFKNAKLTFEKTILIQDHYFRVKYLEENRIFLFKE